MNGSNILFLGGEETLMPLLEEKRLYISFITQLETLGYKSITEKESRMIKSFLNECIIIDINPLIKDITIKLRREYSLKLPDCIIQATALYLNIPLITADTDFKKVKELDLILFE